MSDDNPKAVEDAIAAHVKEVFGEAWPTVAYFAYVRVTDPETMESDTSLWIVPEGQRSFVTRGLLEEARSEYEADHLPVVSFADIDDWDDDE